jgi:hypothetical protein
MQKSTKRNVLNLLGATVFSGAFLLFCSEPMIGKMLLPLLGGVTSVWMTCVLFFQLVLLAGYIYVHLIERFLDLRLQIAVHCVLLVSSVFFLPIRFTGGPDEAAVSHPAVWLLVELTKTVGIPFFVVSTTAPLVQNWLTKTEFIAGTDPYFLYALSNGGSLGALLAYPLLIEPNFGVRLQSSLWFVGYALFVLMVFSVAAAALRYRGSREQHADPPEDVSTTSVPTWSDRLYWTAAAFVPSALMLAVTNHILQNLAPVPLLWIIPLAIYLMTLMIAFGRTSRFSIAHLSKVFPFIVLLLFPIVVNAGPIESKSSALVMTGHLLVLLIGGLLCHRALASSRPGPRHLTEFYVWTALGGALGGMFTAVVAPLLFRRIIEYPLLVAMLALFRVQTEQDRQRRRTDWIFPAVCFLALLIATIVLAQRQVSILPNLSSWLWVNAALLVAVSLVTAQRFRLALVIAGVALVYCIQLPGLAQRTTLAMAAIFVSLALIFQNRRWRFASMLAVLIFGYWTASAMRFDSVDQELFVDRNFFGMKKVLRMGSKWQVLLHGDTIHGLESLEPQMAAEPLSYFHKTGPVGDVMEMTASKPNQQIGVVGLGAGTIAAYGNTKRRISFYEIDPEVYTIARDYFGYLQRCGENCSVAVGDGRLLVEKVDDRKFDVLMLDAFNSDAVPPHLISREAIHIYLSKLKPHGLLVFNVTNGYLQLERLVGAVTAAAGLNAFVRYDFDTKAPGKSASAFVVAARTRADLGSIAENKNWIPLTDTGRFRPWTDDYSNMLEIVRWHRSGQ